MLKPETSFFGGNNAMRAFLRLGVMFFLYLPVAHSLCDTCCSAQHGIQYCDSSTGRYVCRNGEYSSCYCTRHAVMNMQKFEGCCLWKGGVLRINPMGIVVCRDGGFSELCSREHPRKKVAAY